MRIQKILPVLLLLVTVTGTAQIPGPKPVRVVDTLTAEEKAQRNPVILRSELDSLLQPYLAAQQQAAMNREPEKQEPAPASLLLTGGLLLAIGLLGLLVYFSVRNRQQLRRALLQWEEHKKQGEAPATSPLSKGKTASRGADAKSNDLQAELLKLSRENEGLSRVIKEYNGIQHDYDAVKQGIRQSYKIKNYPGFDRTKNETIAIQGVLHTEKAVAAYAYDKFLKQVFAIADANKNNPARIPPADQEKLLDNLLSLSLLYIEYLYLRVNDLSIGGRMVERIQGIGTGKDPDTSLLRPLNTEMGSRALVLRMLLDKLKLRQLSYPVFDETNLNIQ